MSEPAGVWLYESYRRLRRRAFTMLVRGGFRSFGAGSALEPPTKLVGVRQISLGREVYVGPNSWLCFLGPADAPGLTLGDGVNLSGECVLSAVREIVIEDHVLMGRHVHISDHAHGFSETGIPIIQQPLGSIAPVRICAGAWLGQGVVVCPGVTIGRNAVIGANSVVRADVPAFCLAAGAPATVRRRIEAPRAP